MSDSAAENVTVIGAGGHARVVIATMLDAGLGVARVVDGNVDKHGTRILGFVVEPHAELCGRAIIAIGRNASRREIASRHPALDWTAAVHPSAYVHPSARIGVGTVVFAGAVIQPGAKVGDHVIVNTSVTVDHDCIIGDFAHLAPGTHLAGNVQLGQGAFLGVGCCATPNVTIGSWTTVGAGGVVVSDLPDQVTAVGVPARPAQG